MASPSPSPSPASRLSHRRRSSSVSQIVDNVASPSTGTKDSGTRTNTLTAPSSFFRDVYTMRWMLVPSASAKIASVFILGYINWAIFTPRVANPFQPFLFISHPVPTSRVLLEDPKLALSGDTVRYQKGWLDICFVLFYVIVWSFVRQATVLYIWRPFGLWWGIKNETKLVRLMEQGYALMYWGTFGIFGLYVMSFQPSWWFKLEYLWIGYPPWLMRPELKVYYLLQSSYWLQQALVMLLKLEKPRKDYYELIAHHIVTLWLIFWSYLINLTLIGTTVFVCMDIPDAWFALSKGLNYLALERTTTVVFGIFICVWTYFRIYLSAMTLVSVWTQMLDLVPKHTLEWNPEKGWWLAPWMKYQVFTPLFLLLLLNLFWYYLIWKILIRTLRGVTLADDREEGEYDVAPPPPPPTVAAAAGAVAGSSSSSSSTSADEKVETQKKSKKQ